MPRLTRRPASPSVLARASRTSRASCTASAASGELFAVRLVCQRWSFVVGCEEISASRFSTAHTHVGEQSEGGGGMRGSWEVRAPRSEPPAVRSSAVERRYISARGHQDERKQTAAHSTKKRERVGGINRMENHRLRRAPCWISPQPINLREASSDSAFRISR